MPFPVKAFSVKIASPPEAAMETVIARQVIDGWNADYAREEGMVLLPETDPGSGEQPEAADALLAFFCTALGAPTDPSALEISCSIERHLQAGRPVFIYFSEARTGFIHAGPEQVKILLAFKAGYSGQAMVDSFRDEKELRSKFAQHLAVAIQVHPHFRSGSLAATSETMTSPVTPDVNADISKIARVLLLEAGEDPEAYIGLHKNGGELKLQVNGKQLVDLSQPGSMEKWETAFQELLTLRLIREAGCHGRLFQISPEGFDFLKSIGKSPVGYSIELD